MTVRIIAEAGENHLGDVDRAVEMVRLAAASGADFIKFQSYSEADLSADVGADTRAWIQRTQLSVASHARLKQEAERRGISFLSTAVNVKWAKILRDMGCQAIKLASLSLVNERLLNFAGQNFAEVFISTGMGDLGEIDRAISCLGNQAKLTLLHCVSEYPVRDERVSLRSINFMQERFKVSIGYSDHTIGIVACLAAVALGAELIEKHFSLDKTLEGTDHILSADPAELAQIAHGCHRIAQMRGQLVKAPNPAELKNRLLMRQLFIEVED